LSLKGGWNQSSLQAYYRYGADKNCLFGNPLFSNDHANIFAVKQTDIKYKVVGGSRGVYKWYKIQKPVFINEFLRF